MFNSHVEAFSLANKAAALPPDSTALEIKVQPADAIFGSAPLKDAEKVSAPGTSSFFGRLLRYGSRTVAVACLCGLAWAGGRYYSLGHWPRLAMRSIPAAEVQQSPERDETASTVRQMAEEIRALKTSVEGMGRQDAGAENAKTAGNTGDQESLKSQLDSMQAATKAAIADLAARIDKLEADSATKLSQVSEQLDGIEHHIAPPPAPAAVASRTPPPHKRVHLHDAFDPSRDPAALGAPHPLGSPMNSIPPGPKAH
jgi:hypothetical protein